MDVSSLPALLTSYATTTFVSTSGARFDLRSEAPVARRLLETANGPGPPPVRRRRRAALFALAGQSGALKHWQEMTG